MLLTMILEVCRFLSYSGQDDGIAAVPEELVVEKNGNSDLIRREVPEPTCLKNFLAMVTIVILFIILYRPIQNTYIVSSWCLCLPTSFTHHLIQTS